MEFYCRNFRQNRRNRAVSIPNGMEFYPAMKPAANLSGRFNSQRDGILRLLRRPYRYQALSVSIPNGMEFYITMPYSAETNVGFNSQRDGILHELIQAP